MEFTPTQKRFATWGAIAGLSACVLWLLAPVLAPFVVASVLAYALTPVVDWLDDLGRGRIPRLLAVVVVVSAVESAVSVVLEAQAANVSSIMAARMSAMTSMGQQ